MSTTREGGLKSKIVQERRTSVRTYLCAISSVAGDITRESDLVQILEHTQGLTVGRREESPREIGV